MARTDLDGGGAAGAVVAVVVVVALAVVGVVRREWVVVVGAAVVVAVGAVLVEVAAAVAVELVDDEAGIGTVVEVDVGAVVDAAAGVTEPAEPDGPPGGTAPTAAADAINSAPKTATRRSRPLTSAHGRGRCPRGRGFPGADRPPRVHSHPMTRFGAP
jgi:hypothetical protein